MWNEEVIDAPPGGPFVLRSNDGAGIAETSSPSPAARVAIYAPGHAPIAIRFDDRNRREPTAAQRASDMNSTWVPNGFSLDLLPDIHDVIDVEYPRDAIRTGTRWQQHLRRVKTVPANVPEQIALDLEWRVLGVEVGRTGERAARVECDGDMRTSAREANGSHRVEATIRVSCAARISLTDGHTSRWRIDSSAQTSVDGVDGMTATTRTEGVIAHEDASLDAVDADICATARGPRTVATTTVGE